MNVHEFDFVFVFFISPFHSDYRTFTEKPDIRLNKRGRERLHYQGYKFSITNKNELTTLWSCTKKLCTAAVFTMEIDGELQMKLIRVGHLHTPNGDGNFSIDYFFLNDLFEF